MNRRKRKTEKLNLIPILDAIFIFIFFLLMSAQFIDMYEINSEAPIVSEVDSNDKKEPLNLFIKISKDKVSLHTGFNGKFHKKFKITELKALNKELVELKKLNNKEHTATISPQRNTEYKTIIKVIDSVKRIKEKNLFVEAYSPSGKLVKTDELFPQIVFDSKDS